MAASQTLRDLFQSKLILETSVPCRLEGARLTSALQTALSSEARSRRRVTSVALYNRAYRFPLMPHKRTTVRGGAICRDGP
jgi:hypothetical protein